MTYDIFNINYIGNLIFTFVIGIQALVFFLIFFTIISDIIKRNQVHTYFKSNVIDNNSTNATTKGKKNIYIDVSKGDLKVFNTEDIDALKDYFYELFISFENAYNNLDYNTMKMVSTEQLYNNYYTGISLDLKVGKKRVINNIQKVKVILYEVDSTISKQVASLMIEVSYINYTLNNKGYIVTGNKDKPITEKFDVTFRKDFEKKPITKCPNCGANLTGPKCQYCDSVIKESEFKISSIKRIIN